MFNFITIMPAFPIRWKGTFIAGLAALLMAVHSFAGSSAFAQLPKLLNAPQADTKERQPEVKATNPAQQREIIEHALAEARKEQARTIVMPPGSTRQDVEQRARLFDGLVSRLNSQLKLLDEREELLRARDAAEQKSKNWAGFTEQPPYSVLMVDEVRRQAIAARARVAGLRAARELLTQQVETYRDSAKRTQENKRLAAEELEHAQSPEERLSAAWRKERAEIRTRNAEAMEDLAALRYEMMGERLGIAQIELELLERQSTEAGKRMVFTREDLNKTLANLVSSRARLEQEMEAALVRDTRNMSVLAQVQQELDTFTARHGTGGSTTASGSKRDELEARQRAALARVESSRFETEVVTALISMNQSASAFWEQRFTAATGKDAEKQRGIFDRIRRNRDQIAPWLEYAKHQLETYQSAEREQAARLAGIGEQSPLLAPEREVFAARRIQRELAERLKTALEGIDIELQSWQEGFKIAKQSRTLSQRLHDALARIVGIARKIWRFELFTIEDSVEVAGQRVVTSRGVTVGKSVGAILLFLLGYGLAAFTGRRVQRILVTRFDIGEHQANLIRRWLLTLATFALLVATLNLVRIPLTVFAFFGGALAIGVGFGTQTLIKNLISGIMILLERKVQVGDTIDVDGVVGKITTVDIRSSTILGFDGVETVIPNSTFLENKVTNWTHTNVSLRRFVRVGVAYGSPTTRVRDILAECGERHDLILKDPPPQVFFEDFGDNAQVFGLYFWIDYGPDVNPLRVTSDLRFMIDQRFAEDNIALAFPQRDVHLDSARPLRVEVVSTSVPTSSSSGKA